MCFFETRQTARQLVIGRLAAFKREPSDAALQSLKMAIEAWLKTMEAADPTMPRPPGTSIS